MFRDTMQSCRWCGARFKAHHCRVVYCSSDHRAYGKAARQREYSAGRRATVDLREAENEKARKYRRENGEHIRARERARHARNHNARIESQRRWRAKNRDVLKARNRKAYAEQVAALAAVRQLGLI